MPEGDTIHRVAALLRPRLAGHTLTGGSLRDAPGLDFAGRVVADVRALGKHLLVDFADGACLRSHLGMHGSWHRYAPREAWRKPRRRASIVLSTEADVVVCFDASEVRLGRRGSMERELARRAGPDLTADAVDWAEVGERVQAVRAHDGQRCAADLLLDQRVACGIGNVYKSEVLFLERIDPRAPVHALDDDRIGRALRTAHRLLRANLVRPGRMTRDVDDGRGTLWVYGRAGQACLRCGATVRVERLGRGRRSTYACPACQAPPIAPRGDLP